MPYHVTEPHPSVPTARSKIYFPTGIGGAGNIRSYTASALTSGPTAVGPASLASLTPPPTSAARMMLTGRGGAGNVRKPTSATSDATTTSSTSAAARAARSLAPSPVTRPSFGGSTSSDDDATHHAIFAFDEELLREQRMHENAARVYIGRGGAGNVLAAPRSNRQPEGLSKGRAGSIASASSGSSTGSTDGAKRGLGGVVDGIRRTLSRS